jgi:hypothetical protein
LFLYRRRGDVFEPWLRQPSFLKTVQGEDVWIETYLKENRCAREREAITQVESKGMFDMSFF